MRQLFLVDENVRACIEKRLLLGLDAEADDENFGIAGADQYGQFIAVHVRHPVIREKYSEALLVHPVERVCAVFAASVVT